MSVYLDASVIVAMFVPDAFAARAQAFLDSGPSGVIISDFASAEFASAIGIRLRMGLSTAAEAQGAFSNLDDWTGKYASVIESQPVDIREAQSVLRRLDLNVRAPDAIHLMMARRCEAALATFDTGMATCAQKLGIAVAAL